MKTLKKISVLFLFILLLSQISCTWVMVVEEGEPKVKPKPVAEMEKTDEGERK